MRNGLEFKEQDKEIPPPEGRKRILEKPVLFSPPAVGKSAKNQRMIFLALKTEDGRMTRKFILRMLGVSQRGFYKYLANKDRPWKYQDLADAMKEIASEDEYNDTYGRLRMYRALCLGGPKEYHQRENHIPGYGADWPETIGQSENRTESKADREAAKSDDLLKRDFHSDAPLKKCITDITEIGIQWETVCICDLRLL